MHRREPPSGSPFTSPAQLQAQSQAQSPAPSPARIIRAFLIGTVVLACFTGDEVELWTHDLPPGPVANTLIEAAQHWRAATHALGLDRPHAVLRSGMRALESKEP